MLNLETDVFIDLLKKAIEKDLEEKLWEKWLVELPHMDEKSFVPFDEYKNKHFRQESTRSDEDILKDAENILKSMSKPK